jgi:hypothetical protein
MQPCRSLRRGRLPIVAKDFNRRLTGLLQNCQSQDDEFRTFLCHAGSNDPAVDKTLAAYCKLKRNVCISGENPNVDACAFGAWLRAPRVIVGRRHSASPAFVWCAKIHFNLRVFDLDD